MLLIQHLKTEWDKSTRGAQEGAGRRKVPEALTFSAPDLPEVDEVWIQHLWSGNSGEWRSSTAKKVEPAETFVLPFLWSSLRVVPKEGKWLVERQESSVPVITLRRGETGQVRIQGRNMSSSYCWLEKHVFNFAFLERYDPEVFRLRPFTHVHEDMPDLTYAPSSSPVPARWRIKSRGKKEAWTSAPWRR